MGSPCMHPPLLRLNMALHYKEGILCYLLQSLSLSLNPFLTLHARTNIGIQTVELWQLGAVLCVQHAYWE